MEWGNLFSDDPTRVMRLDDHLVSTEWIQLDYSICLLDHSSHEWMDDLMIVYIIYVRIVLIHLFIYSMTQRMTPVHGEQFSKHYKQTGHHGENHRIPGTEGQWWSRQTNNGSQAAGWKKWGIQHIIFNMRPQTWSASCARTSFLILGIFMGQTCQTNWFPWRATLLLDVPGSTSLVKVRC